MVDHHDCASGETHALIIDVDQKVWTYGDGNDAQLGILQSNIRFTDPKIISDLPPAVSVACGTFHSLVLDTNDQVWGFGNNMYGQLGNTLVLTAGLVTKPMVIPEWSSLDIISISAGDIHNLALDRDGKVYALGSDLNGQTSVPFLGNHRIVKISAGSHHNLLLSDEGKVFSFGAAAKGRLGRNNYSTQVGTYLIPIADIAAGYAHNLLLDHDGQVLAFGSNKYGQLGTSKSNDEPFPVKVPNLKNIIQIATGKERSLALNKDGRVWFTGLVERRSSEDVIRTFRLLEGLPVIRKIASGYKDNLLMDETGKFWILGYVTLDHVELKPDLIEVPHIIGNPSQLEVNPTVFMTYPLAKHLLDRGFFVDYRERPDLQSSISNETMMEFEDAEGHEYLAIVKYNAPRDAISRPFTATQARYYEILRELIKNNKLDEFEFRPDLYSDDDGDQALIFKYLNTIYILIINRYEDEDGNIQIYPSSKFF